MDPRELPRPSDVRRVGAAFGWARVEDVECAHGQCILATFGRLSVSAGVWPVNLHFPIRRVGRKAVTRQIGKFVDDGPAKRLPISETAVGWRVAGAFRLVRQGMHRLLRLVPGGVAATCAGAGALPNLGVPPMQAVGTWNGSRSAPFNLVGVGP